MITTIDNQEDDIIETKIISDNTINSDDIVNLLKNIYDPELPVNIYDLGLIYEIIIKDYIIDISMTLTSPNCPEAVTLPEQVEEVISSYNDVKKTSVNITWEPQWSYDRMTDEVKLELGLL